MAKNHQLSPTPGEWTYVPALNRIESGSGTTVAIVVCQGDDEAETDANGYLLASAKELLSTCEEFVRKVDCGEARSVRSYGQMKAAIARAKGIGK